MKIELSPEAFAEVRAALIASCKPPKLEVAAFSESPNSLMILPPSGYLEVGLRRAPVSHKKIDGCICDWCNK